jgi:hypothetical protein
MREKQQLNICDNKRQRANSLFFTENFMAFYISTNNDVSLRIKGDPAVKTSLYIYKKVRRQEQKNQPGERSLRALFLTISSN